MILELGNVIEPSICIEWTVDSIWQIPDISQIALKGNTGFGICFAYWIVCMVCFSEETKNVNA